MTTTPEPLKTAAAERIVQAAHELFGELGYEAASLRKISERAGVAKGLAFHHFGSKSKLLEYVLYDFYQRQREVLAAAIAPDKPARERLHELADAYFDFTLQNYHFPKLIQTITARDPAALEIVQRQFEPMFEWAVDLILEVAPATGPMAARQLYMTISSMVLGYVGYAEIVAPAWGDDPLSVSSLQERRDHFHFVIETLLAAVPASPPEG